MEKKVAAPKVASEHLIPQMAPPSIISERSKPKTTHVKRSGLWGPWVAQPVEHLPFGGVMIPGSQD